MEHFDKCCFNGCSYRVAVHSPRGSKDDSVTKLGDCICRFCGRRGQEDVELATKEPAIETNPCSLEICMRQKKYCGLIVDVLSSVCSLKKN